MFSTHDPANTIVSWNGIIITGFAEGSMVAVDRAEDGYTMVTGAQGDTTRVRNRNRNGSVTVRLQPQAPANALLSAKVMLGEGLPTDLDLGPLQVKDLSTGTVVASVAAWIRKTAAIDLAADLTEREWVFDCYNLVPLHGSAITLL